MLIKVNGNHLGICLGGNVIYERQEKQMDKILIVEDDVKLNNGIKLALRSEYQCIQAWNMESARNILIEQEVDLILLDINLPDGNGMDFLTELRQKRMVPVIILTANNMEMDIVTGLELGANDYITKPFSLMVLRARVAVQLRTKNSQDNEYYQNEELHFDFRRMEFFKGTETLLLSKTEQKLLRCLIDNKGRTVNRNQLIDEVWQGETEFVDEHALTVAVNRLRSKLEDNQECIKTIYGVGYTWVRL